jgi:hypothetical protein
LVCLRSRWPAPRLPAAVAAADMAAEAAAFMRVVLAGAPASEAEAVASDPDLSAAAFPVARR